MNCNNDNDWLEIEILTGLQKLSCLSMDRTPAAEILPGTAQAWMEAITDGMAWDERRDAERVAATFRVLARISRRWPLPAEFLAALPPVPPLPALSYERKPASPEVIERARKQVEAMALGVVQPVPFAKVEREKSPLELAAIEQDLRQHYDAKRAAAGDDQ